MVVQNMLSLLLKCPSAFGYIFLSNQATIIGYKSISKQLIYNYLSYEKQSQIPSWEGQGWVKLQHTPINLKAPQLKYS